MNFRTLTISLLVFCFTVYANAFYLNLTPSQRKVLSQDWLEAAKAFEKANKKNKAIASYKHAYKLYPFSDSGEEAKNKLNEYGIKLSYTKDEFLKLNLKQAKKYESTSKYIYSVNAYLMAYEVSGDPEYIYKAGLVAYKNNNEKLAKDLVQKAIELGYDKSKVKKDLMD